MAEIDLTDHGPQPYVLDIEEATLGNDNFRATLWTGKNLQLTVMTIQPGDDIGLEVHDDHDQFLRIEQGTGTVRMGPSKDDLSFEATVSDDDVVLVERAVDGDGREVPQAHVLERRLPQPPRRPGPLVALLGEGVLEPARRPVLEHGGER